MKLDVIGIGTVVVDQELILPRYPDADSKVEIMGDRLQVGGPVPTALVFLRRLGKRCGFLGKWAAALKRAGLGNRASLPGKQALLNGMERWFRIDAEQIGLMDR